MLKNDKMIHPSNSIGSISRTKFSNTYPFRNTFSAGYLFPIYASEVLPSEEKSINVSELVRSITPLGPTMDNSFLDIFFFFVPKRLVWDHWEEFIAGYNKEAWAQDVEYTVPKIIFHSYADDEEKPAFNDNTFLHCFLDYLPGSFDPVAYARWSLLYSETNINNLMAIDALYPRAYVKIWNDWFRDENLQDELQLYTGDNDEYADDFAFDLLDPTAIPKAAKYHNRFTDALPAPQKGADVLIPMKGLEVGFNSASAGTVSSTSVGPFIQPGASIVAGFNQAVTASTSVNPGIGNAYIANNVTNTIRMLQVAYQTEMFLAKDAHWGTRYIESIYSHFKVSNGDARLQRSEYLGSKHIPLSVTQVTNTAASSGNPLGNVGGQSMTRDSSHFFSKGFTEHGIVFGLAVVRTSLSYSSGIRKQYQRFTRFDHIWPEFKHIGDVPLYTRELHLASTLLGDENHVFGYTPYGSELREGYNYNQGLFRAEANGSLAYLTYQEKYDDALYPVLSGDWIEQDTKVVSDTLVDSEGPQFYALWKIDEERVVPIDPTSDFRLIGHF